MDRLIDRLLAFLVEPTAPHTFTYILAATAVFAVCIGIDWYLLNRKQ